MEGGEKKDAEWNSESKTEKEEPDEMKKKGKTKKYKLDDDFQSIFPDGDARNRIFDHLPLIKVKKMKKNPKQLNTISGPYDIQYPLEIFEPWICGRSISTYPHIPGKPARDGDPICDSYCVQMLEEDSIIALVCDGCNWGRRPMEASNAAKSSFIDYLRSRQGDIVELRDVGHYLLQALSYCHHKIVEGKEDVWEAGTTTLLGGMLFRVKKPKEERKSNDENEKYRWVWICVSIGDCKAFHYKAAQKEIYDITAGNRRNAYDAKDPGGRLGPYVGNGEPDVRNVTIYYTFCQENDLILVLSDGVHDNLDPQTLGKLPKDSGNRYSSIDNWRAFATEKEAQECKDQFMKKFLINELILGGESDERLRAKVFSPPKSEEPYVSPTPITGRIMKHCMSVTGSGREWMEQNPKEKLPMDYVLFPGKMDHATAVVIRVAPFEKELEKAMKGGKVSEVKLRQSGKNHLQ